MDIPRLCRSSPRKIGPLKFVVGVAVKDMCVGVDPPYHAHPLDCPLNILNLSYTDSFCCCACCSFCEAKLRKTRFIEET